MASHASPPGSEPGPTITYENELEEIVAPLPLLADYPTYVEPVQYERRYLAPPLVDDDGGKLLVRAWRYWYNARGIIETENRLEAKATAIIMVHPWGLDDGCGLRTPQPAGVAFFCTREKNELALEHVKDVVNPFLRRLRDHVALVGYSLPGQEDDIRKLLYPSVTTRPDQLNIEEGQRELAELLAGHRFDGLDMVTQLTLDTSLPVRSYFAQTPSTDAWTGYNGEGFWELPMPIMSVLERGASELVFYEAEGFPKVRDYLKSIGVRHVLLTGYATDMCVIETTCGYGNLSRDFNVFLVGDATLATFPGSTTPRFATQVALANAALHQMITQVGWVRLEGQE